VVTVIVRGQAKSEKKDGGHWPSFDHPVGAGSDPREPARR